MISKLLKKIGIKGIEIKQKEENPEGIRDIHNILSKNFFSLSHSLLGCTDKYCSNNEDNRRGRILLTDYSEGSPDSDKKAFLGFIFVKEYSIKQIKKELYEMGYSFEEN